MPLARPLLHGQLTHNVLWAPAMENKKVRAWYDDFGAQIAQAQEDIKGYQDPAFWNPRLLRPEPDEPGVSP